MFLSSTDDGLLSYTGLFYRPEAKFGRKGAKHD